MPKPFIAIHVGAGFHSDANSHELKSLCQKACKQAMRSLRKGASSADAAVLAISILENSPYTNAGKGSNLGLSGTVECDASIMDGRGNFGAVGAVEGIGNPILVAYSLLKESSQGCLPLGRVPPLVLVGDGAHLWARQHHIPTCSPDDLITDRAQAVFLDHVTRLEEVTGDIVLTRCLTEATGDGLVTRGGLPQEREGNPEEGGGRGREGATKRGKHRLEERGEGRTREQCQTAKQPCREKAKRRHSDQEGGEAVGKRKCLFQEERRSCLEKRGKRGKRGVSEKRLKPTDQQNAEVNPQPATGHAPQEQPAPGHAPQEQPAPGHAPQEQPAPGHAPQEQPAPGHAPQEQPAPGPEEQSLRTGLSLDPTEGRSASTAPCHAPLDTVGAICLDVQGTAAAGVSSGGISLKSPGRAGQAMMYGCGCWADSGVGSRAIAASTSGTGEYIIKTSLARECAEAMVDQSLDAALEESFLNSKRLHGVDQKLAGAIAFSLNADDVLHFSWGHTTESMCIGFMGATHKEPTAIISKMENPARSGLASHIQAMRILL